MQVSTVPQCIQDFMASPDAEGVDVIGLVSHAGLETDIEVATRAQRADFIISAHSHTAMFPGGAGPCLQWGGAHARAWILTQLRSFPMFSHGDCSPILHV